ncbi:histone acetyltransferase [Malassezia sp. CBS 17886]|nr:histone acetyltransferase [Malassezia sp. CBS 17886]
MPPQALRADAVRVAASARNVDRVVFDEYDIRAWYASPYPLDNGEERKHTDTPCNLWVCAGCFKYMQTARALYTHRRTCTHCRPPGRKVYQRGAHIIWEVDGAAETLYTQNLCLFGKLFIDHKTIFFDVDPFLCYVLTDATSQFDHVLGFFSKEKLSYDDYNLACIVVFPPYQRRGYGTLLMEYSYVASQRAGVAGTPERPLSELGLKGYISFWTATLLRALQRAFIGTGPGADAVRAVLAGEAACAPRSTLSRRPPLRTQRGWAGELGEKGALPDAADAPVVPMPSQTTLARIAAAAGLRVEDATLALAHAGLLERMDAEAERPVCESTHDGVEPRGGMGAAPSREPTLVLEQKAVDAAAARFALKPAILDPVYLL